MSRVKQNKTKTWFSRMDEDNEYNHAPSSSAAILKGLRGPVGTSYDHSPYVVVLQAASRGLTSDYLLMCVGRGVRGGAILPECVIAGLSHGYRSPGPSQEARERASWAKSAEANAAGPADIGMN